MGNPRGSWGGGKHGTIIQTPRMQLIGPRNEVRTEVNGGLEMTLVDSGTQISGIPDVLCTKLDLPMWQLPDEVNFVGFGGVTLKTKGYTRIW